MTRRQTVRPQGTAWEVFCLFLTLGLTSFGGPVAHLGYFRDAVVTRRGWLGERAYADLVALCQFLPGPASSQVGMAIGLQRAGYAGMLAAWTAFTLPSAMLLVAFAFGIGAFETKMGAEAGWVQGLKAAAVAVVAHAVLGMARNLAPDKQRATIAVGGMIVAMLMPTAVGQVLAIAIGAAAGLLWLKPADASADGADNVRVPVSRRAAFACLAAFAVLLVVLPLWAATGDGVATMVDSYYRAGALVFGGGHVVLPLLQAEVVGPGLVDRDAFLAGYGAAQAVPGPLFTFAAFLGAVHQQGPSGLVGAVIALLAIFLPSALLIVGTLPFWDRLRTAPNVRRALMGVNAAVVGLLAAALYDPVFSQGIASAPAMAIAAAGFVALTVWKAPAWAVVVVSGVVGAAVLGAGA
ncbi:chromate efflux transporter [Fodinicurvata sp. EGI_FJ10296]|uniref:chromate efflux transporter n=1 Tax=Fodinicurvata sp. EGI_FJ10296 TaxID=3231908 RepID=UPI0034554E76